MRASRRRTGFVDVDGLMGWRKLESAFHLDLNFPRHAAVRSGHDQQWNHENGSEWLAANPVLVPGLNALLLSSLQNSRTSGSTTNNTGPMALDTSDDPGNTLLLERTTEDPFAKLPRELSDAIFDFLCPTDVASLRLASCARFLPLSTWKSIIYKEMPWLWEAWDDKEPSFWALVSHHDLAKAIEKQQDALASFYETQAVYSSVIQEEMPEIWDEWSHDNQWLFQMPSSILTNYLDPESPALNPPTMLPQEGTNWCRLYYKIKTHWQDLQGLQNRQRIWNDVEEILNRISRYREEGKIQDGAITRARSSTDFL